MKDGKQHPRTGRRLFVFTVLAVLLILLDTNSAVVKPVRTALFVTVKPLIATAEVPVLFSSWLQHVFEDRAALQERNVAITLENRQLQEKINRLERVEQHNQFLSQALEAQDKMALPVMVANLISVQLRPNSQAIVLDRGVNDGVFVGMPVLDHKGVIGQVVKTTLTDSAVILITDPGHSIPVRFKRTGIRAIAHGFGQDDSLLIEGITPDQDVIVGDVLITSGLGNRFPRGYPVAKVVSVEHNINLPFMEIAATPLSALEPEFEVMMVWYDGPSYAAENSVLSMKEPGVVE